jgi:hypothetical protein
VAGAAELAAGEFEFRRAGVVNCIHLMVRPGTASW